MGYPYRTRDVLAQNIRKLLADEQGGMRAISDRIGVGEGTLSRVKAGSHAATVDTLDALAKYFHLEPWQLLCPAFEKGNPPLLAQVSAQQLELLDRFKRLAATLPRDE